MNSKNETVKKVFYLAYAQGDHSVYPENMKK